jgi:dynactin-4
MRLSTDKATIRCTRNCFQCPLCTAPLSVSSLDLARTGFLLGTDKATQQGPYVLSCGYCNWSSKEIGIKFERPNGIYSQLSKIKNGGEAMLSSKESREREERRRNEGPSMNLETDEDGVQTEDSGQLDLETQFSRLKAFYQSQLADTEPAGSMGFSGDYGYGSPSSLSRIMGLYTKKSHTDPKPKTKQPLMREAYDASEGLNLYSADRDNEGQRLATAGWEGTTSQEQRVSQITITNTRFVSDLRPVPYLLRSRYAKRCRQCRHILTKPEDTRSKTRFQIRLLAQNTVPSMVTSLLSPPPTLPGATQLPAGVLPPPPMLTPHKPTQFLLTMKNPLYENVKITLATPGFTPGRFKHKVTILCPQFEIGKDTDVWDDALQVEPGGRRVGGISTSGLDRDGRRLAAKVASSEGGLSQAEAGKVWDKGKNWVSVVVEVVLASSSDGARPPELGMSQLPQLGKSTAPLDNVGEDEAILEVPIFVRMEWRAEFTRDPDYVRTMKELGREEEEGKEDRELAFWTVLGLGRIAQV